MLNNINVQGYVQQKLTAKSVYIFSLNKEGFKEVLNNYKSIENKIKYHNK